MALRRGVAGDPIRFGALARPQKPEVLLPKYNLDVAGIYETIADIWPLKPDVPGICLRRLPSCLQTLHATLIPRLSFEQLTDTSELIVSGRISDSWAAWDPQHKYIFGPTTGWSVASIVKGNAASVVVSSRSQAERSD